MLDEGRLAEMAGGIEECPQAATPNGEASQEPLGEESEGL
jgi:hypothetical protein